MNSSSLSDPLAQFIFASTTNGILIADANGILERVNPAAAALLGLSASDLIGQAVNDCFAVYPALLNLFALPEAHCRLVDLPDQRQANGVAATISTGQRIVLLQDVSSQSDLIGLREAFVSTLAHDLRNPIAALIGYAELVGETGDLNDDQRHFVNRLNQTAVKLHNFAAELIDLSWLEAGLPISTVTVSLHDLIEAEVALLTAAARNKQISIAVAISAPLPLVIGDPDRLRLAIVKLLDNAIAYSGSGHDIAVRAWSDEQHVYCSVADKGIGISPDDLDLIFDRLYRSRSEAVQQIPGAGLGLTIAQRIVLRHGGAIWAESELGSGTTVTFKLPAVAPVVTGEPDA